jgi:DNA-directed RNA polymerase specialized sigma24 family protein
MDPPRLSWPSLEEGYTDEFGVIYPEVYLAAGELWPQAEGFVNSKLHDCPAGLRLMLKAAAAVSRKLQEQPDQIRDLKAYLWTTFKRLVSDEVEKENRYQPLEPEQQHTNNSHAPSETLDDQILIEEVMAQMDPWTRTVFELRVIGHQFEEIAQMLKMRPNLLRSKFHKEIQKLSRKLRG